MPRRAQDSCLDYCLTFLVVVFIAVVFWMFVLIAFWPK